MLLEAGSDGRGPRVAAEGAQHQQKESGGRSPGGCVHPQVADEALPVHLDRGGLESHPGRDGRVALLEVGHPKRADDELADDRTVAAS